MYKNAVDIFPIQFSESLTKLNYPKKIFKFWGNNPGVKVFILFTNDQNKVYYSKKPLDGQYMHSILQIGKGCRKMGRFFPRGISFSNVANRYKHDPDDQMKRNAGFKHENTYLVNSFFTFGLRHVEMGSAHVVQTLNVPIMIYIDPKKTGKMCRGNEKVFPYNQLSQYDYSILAPNGVYRIPPGIRYVLLTTQKTYFSLDVVPETMEIPFSYSDPDKKKIYKLPAMYDRPPKTPHIEVFESEEELEEQQEADDFYSFFQTDPFRTPSANLSNYTPLGETHTIEAANETNLNPPQNITCWLNPRLFFVNFPRLCVSKNRIYDVINYDVIFYKSPKMK